MANNGKILTVSYGAFSCTLEGFDDSVGTLKEITEYFRALSASDPRFGEQEVLPDTANLARIAESNEPRPVQIRTSDRGSILLRAEDAEFVPDPDAAPERRADPKVDEDQETLSLAEVMAHVSERGPSQPDAAQPQPAETTIDSVSAKLQRLRAVVARNAAELEDVDQPEDVDTVEEFFSGSYTGDLTHAHDADEADSEPSGSAADKDGTSAQEPVEVADDLSADAKAKDGPVSAPEPEADSEMRPETGADEDALVSNVLGTLSDTEESLPKDAAPEAEEDFSVPYLLKPEEMISAGSSSADNRTGSDTPQVVKAKRADIDAALAAGKLQDVTAHSAAPSSQKNKLLLGGDELSRLMATADARMDEPESSISRETYSQLRAAVAAAGDARAGLSKETDDAYRHDLANVVQPARDAPKRPGRPAGADRNAPLKLVPDLRIDLEDSAVGRGPVRPRRVYAAADGIDVEATDTDTSFADFAAEQGARDMPELLEAAVAYVSFVEGRKQFSRPQLMSKLRQVEADAFDREGSLRSFGDLLRDGKIKKTSGGRFIASDDIGYRPAQHANG